MERIANKEEIMFDKLMALLKDSGIDKGQKVSILFAVINSVLAPQMPRMQFAPLLAMQLLESCCNSLPLDKRAEYLRAVAEQLEQAAKAVESFRASPNTDNQ
jgi:hypothetical protein